MLWHCRVVGLGGDVDGLDGCGGWRVVAVVTDVDVGSLNHHPEVDQQRRSDLKLMQ
jgi:hypothetical protein